MKISVAMCEGQHDVGFIAKILLANGFASYDKSISEYPYPINNQIEGRVRKEVVGDKKIGFIPNSPMIPCASLIKEDILVLIHNMGGDSTEEERVKLIADYVDIENTIKDKVLKNSNITEIQFLLFFDADEIGISGREELIYEKYAKQYEIPRDEILHGKMNNNGKIKLGIFIFHNENDADKCGTLEDHLLSLISVNNSSIVAKAEEYLDNNKLDEERTREYRMDKKKYKGRSNYSKKKSIISVAGQLQFSGVSNNVIIAKSDYIKEDVLLVDDACQTICALFS